MSLTASPPSQPVAFGLKTKCLTFSETLSQSIANISPTLTPVVIVPLVFGSAGNGSWLAYLFATVGLMLVGVNINQFAKRSASPGSLYAYITNGMGVSYGFFAGWCSIVAYLFTAVSVLAGSVNYALILFDKVNIHVHATLLFSVGALGAGFMSYKDIKLSTRVMLWLEAISMAMIVVLGVIIFAKRGTIIDTQQIKLEGLDFNSLKLGLILAVFSYVGYESSTALGDEASNPLKNIPRAVLLSPLISGIFFMFATYFTVLGFHAMDGKKLSDSIAPLNDLATANGMEWFGVIISFGAVISMFACTLASINAGARVIFMMGRHGILHPHLAKTHKTNKTPHYAIIFAAGVTLIIPAICRYYGMAVLDIFNDISTVATYGFLIIYVLISIAAPIYLKRIGEFTAWSLVPSILGICFMLPPMIATVYPDPGPPINKFPIYFGIYLVIGAAWISRLCNVANPKIVKEIKDDLNLIHAQFSDLKK
jgi:amino acid transporter